MRQPIFVCVKSRPDIEAFVYHEEPNVIYINTACTRSVFLQVGGGERIPTLYAPTKMMSGALPDDDDIQRGAAG